MTSGSALQFRGEIQLRSVHFKRKKFATSFYAWSRMMAFWRCSVSMEKIMIAVADSSAGLAWHGACAVNKDNYNCVNFFTKIHFLPSRHETIFTPILVCMH